MSDSDGMDEAQVAHFTERLSALRDALRAQDSDSASSRDPVTLDQQSVGRLSRMDAMQQQAMAEAEARRRTHDLARIDAAIKRIAAGDYGWCAECGETIAAPRLEVDPMATHCVGCAR